MRKESCKTCKSLIPIMCHPCNKVIGKGRMNKKLGYGCTLPEITQNKMIIFFEKPQGSCECYERRKK